MRMKEKALAHQKISTTNIRDDISTQYNIVICIYYIAYMYRRDDCIGIYLEMVGLYKLWKSMSSMAQLLAFILQKLKISYIKISIRRS